MGTREMLLLLLLRLTFVMFLLRPLVADETRTPKNIKIAGLFETEFEGQQRAFRYAIDQINNRGDILPNIKLTADIQNPRSQDSFSASKKICKQVRLGLAAVFGPMSANSASHVQSVCGSMGLPHVEARWEVPDRESEGFSVNLFPHHLNLSQAFIDVLDKWNWEEFTILYQHNDGLVRLQELLKASDMHNFIIKVRRLPTSTSNRQERVDYRPVLKELRNRGVTRIVLDCPWNVVRTVLHQAMTINMTTQYYHYMLTTLDAGLVDLDDFRYNHVNITAFRLIDPGRRVVRDILREWRFDLGHQGRSPLENELGFATGTALIYDAVHVFANALHDMDAATVVETEELMCTREKEWAAGETCYNYMKMIKLQGLTGEVAFDGKGRRTTFKLDLVELAQDGLEKIGYWDTATGLNITKKPPPGGSGIDLIENKTLRITTLAEAPYMMLINDSTLEGNDRFEGYCVDLLKEIAAILHFNYTIHLVEDKQYGSFNTEKKVWTGMVKEIMDQKADLAVASLTISWGREQVIDFTKPFMNTGISILFKKPEKKNPSLFSFLSPLSFMIWIYMIAAYLVVSFTMFVLARFSPYEWVNPHPCNPDSDTVENQFTLLNSLWFTIGSLMQQGSEVAPRAMSTRLVSGIWWFFTLIMISSYTANLAAFLTVERMSSPIENADDLSKQTAIKYGTMSGGSTMTFFKESTIDTYERMWNFMESQREEGFVRKTEEGIAKVKKGDYAFLLESTMNEYTTQRNCELMQVGGLLDSKGYGIGAPMGSPYRDPISIAILKLQETQVLHTLYNKWWKERGGAKQCDVDDTKKNANALAIANVGGVFVLLVGGLVLSLIVAVLEFAWRAHKYAEEDRQPLCTEMAEELRFAIQCFGSSTKPAKRPPPRVDPPEAGMKLMHLDGYHTKPHFRELYT